MRIPLGTDLKTRTGAPDKDARLKNAYVEVKNGEAMVRKRTIARGGVSVGTGTAQGGIGFNVSGTDYVFTVNGDVTATNTSSIGTNWNSGTAYAIGDHVSVGFVDYWASTNNTNKNPTSSPSDWSTTYVPAIGTLSSWTLGTLDYPPLAQNSPIAWNGSVFCFIDPIDRGSGIGASYTSSDGLTWTRHESALEFLTGDIWPIVWNGTFFCAVSDVAGTGIVSAISFDGISWSIQEDLSTPLQNIYDIAWNGSVFCAVSAANGVATSSNGTTWTLQTFPNAGGANAIAWNGSVFCAIRRSSAIAFTSSNGSSWTQQTLPISSTWERIKACGSTFCILHPGNGAASSIDNGINWTTSTVGYGLGGGICSSNNKFLVAKGDINSPVVSVSTDGHTWTTQTLPATKPWSTVAYGNRFTVIDIGNDPNSTCAASTGL